MDVKELRIGNLVEILGEERTVETISNLPARGEMYWVGTKGLIDVKMIHVKPIKITHEWLLEVGFDVLTRRDRGFKSTAYTYRKGFSFIVDFDDERLSVGFWQGNEKKYKHEFQNFFFALTGKELI